MEGLRCFAVVESEPIAGNKTSHEQRLYISSLAPDAERISQAIRSHWTVENRLHKVMDVSFNDDQMRARTKAAAHNLAVLKYITLNLIRRDPVKRKASIKTRRIIAATSDSYRAELLALKGCSCDCPEPHNAKRECASYDRCMTPRDQLSIEKVRVLDGGMASELEFLGADISGPLWSAHVLEDAPDKVVAVHRAYLEAGAEILLTASYQVSRKGYAELGLSPARADAALLRSVELAQAARSEFPDRHILIAASLGPYGAALHDGSEYHGNYNATFAELVQFHFERIAVLARSGADLLAFETIPWLAEAQAIGEALNHWPELAVWLSFTCCDSANVAHGETLRACAEYAATLPQTVAIGINCTQPGLLASLIREIRSATQQPIVVYPNSGEGWDAKHRCWTGSSDPAAFGGHAKEWFSAGAQIVGGCCRTRPAHIREVVAAIA